MIKILITRKIPSIAQELLEKHFHVDINPEPSLSEKELIRAVEHYDGILTTIADHIDRRVLSHAKNLKAISNFAVGLDNIDLDYARSLGIKIYHLPNIVTHSTADTTFAIFLALVRKICEARSYVREGKWKSYLPSRFLGEELYGKIFGIIGFGRIGIEVARRAIGFGMSILFVSRNKKEIPKDLCGSIQQVSLQKLYEEADYISLHMPLSEESRGMIDYQAMKQMRKHPVLINMARGAVVKTEDLVRALQEGLIRGAALDVTDPEPLPSDHPLCFLENCFVVPHIGTETRECRYQMAKKAAENLVTHFIPEN